MSCESERRRHTRIRCHIACQVVAGRDTVPGMVCDVSAGGLLVNADMEIDQGDTVRVCLEAGRRRPAIEIEAIVWHVRSVRNRRSGLISCAMGLVLSDAPEAYVSLIDHLKPAVEPPRKADPGPKAKKRRMGPQRPRSPRPAAAASAPEAAKPLVEAAPMRFRVRVKQEGKPYTRSIQVFADSAERAREVALAETGEAWVILEVERI